MNDTPDPSMRDRAQSQKPYWDIERCRIGESQKVPVEVIVNGEPVARHEITADGRTLDFADEIQIDKSSWVALRILPSSHTNPIFVEVGGKPIRASTKSAEWCLAGVQKCRTQKKRFIDADEMADFEATYDHAEKEYRRLIEECKAAE